MAAFFNLALRGSSHWWVIMKEDRAQFESFCTGWLRRKLAGRELLHPLRPEQERLLLALVYAKQVYIPIGEIVSAGVPVHHLVQKPGSIVIGLGVCYHQGISIDESGSKEAMNFMPPGLWLHDCLPVLREFSGGFSSTSTRTTATTSWRTSSTRIVSARSSPTCCPTMPRCSSYRPS
jgi:hypothetical protein